MNENEKESEGKGCAASFCCIFIVGWFLTAWFFCDISGGSEYGWLSGIWQGLFFAENWIYSLFIDGHLYKADVYTALYNIFYWIFAIPSCIGLLFTVIMFFTTIFSKD